MWVLVKDWNAKVTADAWTSSEKAQCRTKRKWILDCWGTAGQLGNKGWNYVGVTDLKECCRPKSCAALVVVWVLMKAALLHLKIFSDLIHRFHLIWTVLKGCLQTNKLMFLPVGPHAQFSLLTFLKCLCASLEGDVCIIPAETGACFTIS